MIATNGAGMVPGIYLLLAMTPTRVAGDTMSSRSPRASECSRCSILATLQVPHKAGIADRVVDREAVSGSISGCGRNDSNVPPLNFRMLRTEALF